MPVSSHDVVKTLVNDSAEQKMAERNPTSFSLFQVSDKDRRLILSLLRLRGSLRDDPINGCEGD